MRPWLVGTILLSSATAGILTELSLFRMFQPPDQTSAILSGTWVAIPYLAAAGLAFLLRRNTVGLVVILIALLITAFVGVSLFDTSTTQQQIAEQQARDIVLPGEDANSGPGGMRKAGADSGVAIGGAFSILLVVVLPPVQFAAVVIPAVIGYGISVWLRQRQGRAGDRHADHGSAG